ncbi:MAG TPA: D-Ala-D-Ala carboxypeptidase family metallohydrolase [Gemmatimonadaceae bacterium]|nr:D-Ala-D-Ala carboxypeptidase family metallohydrolase [Gemmatimonadaceae bacterium]
MPGEIPASSRPDRRLTGRWRFTRHSTFGVSLTAAIGFVVFYEPPLHLNASPVVTSVAYGALSTPLSALTSPVPEVEPSLNAFGRSGAVDLRLALPGANVQYPLRIHGDPTGLRYTWRRLADSTDVGGVHDLVGDSLVAPPKPGFYQLVLLRSGFRRPVDGLTLGVLVPFDRKHGPLLDGYRIGMFPTEKHRTEPLPRGFLRVTESVADLQMTRHLRLADFLTHDSQTTWPRFAAVNPKVLDKLELVVEQVAAGLRARDPGDSDSVHVLLSVHSAFRTPYYNRHVPRAAHDSQHQYGDAVDVAIDADGDGRFTAKDTRLVAKAVNAVEAAYPELVGGMGVYTGRAYHHPYVHIDARGERVRWHG